MSIQFLCPHCNKQFRTPDNYAGKLTRCKQCGQTMRIPDLGNFAPGTAPSNEFDDEEVASFPEVDPSGSSVASYPAAPQAVAPAAESGLPQIQVGGPAAPRPQASKPNVGPNKGNAGPYCNINRGTIAITFVAVLFLALGVRDAMLMSESSSTPTKLTVQQLLRSGTKNRHVKLTNAFLWTEGSVYEGASENSKNWRRVWVPMVDSTDPALAAGGKPRVRMILRTSRVKSASQLEGLSAKHEFQGMLTTGYFNLQDDERKMLAQSFPELGTGNVHVFDDGDTPPPAIFMALYFVGGLIFAAAAVYLIFMIPPVEGM